MINAIVVFNNYGKPRLTKFYQYFTNEEQQQIINETFHLVAKRDDQTCNFLELPSTSLLCTKTTENCKLIYRHYATLYFVFCVDAAESELGILDLIQVFVESLDRSFSNVCELDLIFNSDSIHWLLDEIVQSGMVLETNINNIIMKFEEQNKIAKVETSPASAKANSAVSAIKNINLPQLKEKVRDLPNSFKDLKF
ncbi:AP-3 complex subunit sigma-2-like [Chironomus tepperi]|uniref:AP-3 complex subunit sigma-2-like n=1 Tax=Chironomus tepperi TaxID=113505 RepID=UPI00391F9443